MDELIGLSACEAVEKLRLGEVSSLELIDAAEHGHLVGGGAAHPVELRQMVQSLLVARVQVVLVRGRGGNDSAGYAKAVEFALDVGPARPETGFCSVRSRAHEALDAHVPRRLFGAPTWV